MKKFNYKVGIITGFIGILLFSVSIGVVYFFIFGFLFKKWFIVYNGHRYNTFNNELKYNEYVRIYKKNI